MRHEVRLPDVKTRDRKILNFRVTPASAQAPNLLQHHLRHRRAFSISLSEIPLDRAQDSTAASPYSATAFLTTQQGTACAGNEASSQVINTIAQIICRA